MAFTVRLAIHRVCERGEAPMFDIIPIWKFVYSATYAGTRRERQATSGVVYADA